MNNTQRFLIAVLLISFPFLVRAQVVIEEARCENRMNPLGVNPADLFFSWELHSDQESVGQTAYQLVIASTAEKLNLNLFDVYDTDKVSNNQSIQVQYAGKDLESAQTYYWKVRVWDNKHNQSEWSPVQRFTTGIFIPDNWKGAQWIGYENMPDSMRVVPFVHGKMKEGNPKMVKNATSPLLRKKFRASKKVKEALLFISGLGHYEASINGEKVGESFLSPGWTTYDRTTLYNTYDVTDHLKANDNVIGVVLGSGFYHVSQERYVKGTGTFGKPKAIVLMKITYDDGSNDFIVSDNTWKTTPSPITFNNIFGGEDYDARLMQSGWNTPSFDDKNWKAVVLVDPPSGNLLPEIDYPVILLDTFSVQSKTMHGKDIEVYDFGQNVAGIPQIRVSGKAGQVIRIIPSELIDKEGKVNQADQVTPHYYEYTIKGEEEETWQPTFTYFAVRYVQVEGAVSSADNNPARLPIVKELKLLHNRNSSPSNGFFHSSDSLLNDIYELIDWAIKSNLQSYITDNPQREKLSWQGEQNFMREAINSNYEVYNLYRSLVQNMMDAQHANGLVPDIAPEYIKFDGPFVDSPEWGSTAILDMWFLYKFYGDLSMIRKAYKMMTGYATHLESRAVDHLLHYGLGDWLDIGNVTPLGMTASAYYYHSILTLSQLAELIDEKEDARYYKQLANKIKTAFNRAFFNAETMTYGTGSQTAMAMPISMGIVEEKYRKDVINKLISTIREHDDNQLTAGDVGHRYLVKALYENGASSTLYDIYRRDDVPGYGYLLKQGATALVETWDGRLSQNQLAMGHILEWFHSGLIGISQEENSVAFKKLKIAPQPIAELAWAEGSFHSPYGWVKVDWRKESGKFIMNVEIPVNTTANLYLPVTLTSRVYRNGSLVSDYTRNENIAIMEVGSGKYEIQVE